MRTSFFATLVLGLYLSVGAFAQSGIIPAPRSVEPGAGSFAITRDTKLVAMDDVGRQSATILNEVLAKNLGIKLKVTKKLQKNSIAFLRQPNDVTADERYVLDIKTDGISIGGSAAGQFYAIQSLLQLAPATRAERIAIPAMKITDSPRFRYRGMHLDVGRHFMPVSFVKKYIDLISQYKFNYFHWGLTQDQGWRVEIKKYPKLTELGSTRPETVKERNLQPYIGDGIPHGGFYTQEDVKEVVAYAKARHVTVVPEINVPGHSSAALAAYPQYGCKQNYPYKVQTTWGIFKEIYCPTEESFRFLEEVFGEFMELFKDSPYIHIGGDEVPKDHWKESAFVQELKKKENLKDEHEVQSYFVRRIEKIINAKGKKMIGWDEILEGGLAPNATVMSWRGMKGGIEAAKAKHDVIMSPTDNVYLDYGQGDPAYEPLGAGSYIPLEKVYSFEPVPKELTDDEKKFVIGGQGNVWTEYMKTPSTVEYMAFPRMLALAEVVWSQPENKNYADFQRRLFAHLPHLDAQNVNYRIPEPAGLANVITQDEKASITLTPIAGTRVFYTTDGATPDEKSSVYDKPIEIAMKDGEVVTLKTIVMNATGRKSVVYAATVVRGAMREPVVREKTTEGLKYEVFIPKGDMSGDGERKTGETKSIFLNQFANKGVDLKQPFAVMYDGYIKIPADGVYEFQVDSTWDATVVLAGGMLIDDAGTKDRKVKSAVIPLKAGLHRISIRYNHRGGDAAFRFRFGIKGQGLRQAGGSEFVY